MAHHLRSETDEIHEMSALCHFTWARNVSYDHLDRMLQIYYSKRFQQVDDYMKGIAQTYIRMTCAELLRQQGEPNPHLSFAEIVKRNSFA